MEQNIASTELLVVGMNHLAVSARCSVEYHVVGGVWLFFLWPRRNVLWFFLS